MSETIDSAVIKRTQDILGKYVKKPNLSEKLLTKPPFRFLFDVFNVIIRDTGYFKGLYTDDELVYEKIKDRDDKMRFLQKMIDVTKLVSKNDIGVRPSKIVAGHEAEKTNELLQCIGMILDQKLDWQSAVKQVNSDGHDGKETASKKKEKKVEKTTKVTKDSKEKNPRAAVKETKSSNEGKATSRSQQADPKANSKTRDVSRSRGKDDKANTSRDSRSKPLSKGNSVDNSSRERSSVRKPKNDSKTAANHVSEESDTKKRTSASIVRRDSKSIRGSQEHLAPSGKDKQEDAENLNDDLKNANIESTNEDLMQTEVASNNRDVNGHDEEHGNRSLETQPKSLEATMKKTPEKVAQADASQRKSSEARRSSAQRKGSSENSPDKSNERKESEVNNNNNNNSNLISNEVEAPRSLKPVYEEKPSENFNKSAGENGDSVVMTMPATLPAKENKSEMKRDATITHSDSLSSNSSMQQRPRTSLRPPSARPPSARPGAPRRRDKNVEIVLQPNDQIKMSGISVKLEAFGDLDDDGENLVIIEDATKANDLDGMREETAQEINMENGQQGHLVQQILETQKELVQQHGTTNSQIQKTLSETANDLNARQNSAHQMTNLRNVIQSLTRSVNPFGKLMDFIPEDIDAMQFEFNMWRDAYLQAANELKRERNLTESATEPMKNQLLTIDVSIKEYLELIDASRTKILQNNEKILKMLLE